MKRIYDNTTVIICIEMYKYAVYAHVFVYVRVNMHAQINTHTYNLILVCSHAHVCETA